MTLLSRAKSWARTTVHRFRSESEMDTELRFHLDAYTEDLVRKGVPRVEAARRARIEFGAIERAKEECRDAWGTNLTESMINDLRYAARILCKSPGFTVVAVLTLALGIGANTAIFSLVNGVLLSSIPVRDPQQLVVLKWSAKKSPEGGYDSFADCAKSNGPGGCSFSYPMFREFRENVRAFSGVAGFAGPGQFAISGNGPATIANVEFVSGDFFQTLGVEPALGRTLQLADEETGAELVAVISYPYWQTALGGSPSVVGKLIHLNGVPVAVVGVANSRFVRLSPGKSEDMWMSVTQAARLHVPWARDAADPASMWLTIVARIQSSGSRAQAQAEVSLLFRNSILYGAKPLLKEEDDPRIAILPAQEGLAGIRDKLATPLYLMMGAVGVVLLIACANVAGLLVSRAAGRQREIAVRLAIGAGPARIVRQLLTESVLLSAAGATLGIFLASWAVRVLSAFLLAGASNSGGIDVHVDLRVLAFTAGLSVLTGILFGLAPAFRSTRLDIAPTLKQSAGSLLGGAMNSRSRPMRLGNSLVVAQVALSVLVLVAAGLFVRTLANLKSVNPGFDTRNILTFGIDPVQANYNEQQTQTLYRNFRSRLAAIPGVLSASYSSDVLLSGGLWTSGVKIRDDKEKSSIKVQMLAVGPAFFETLRIPLRAGRTFTTGDFGSHFPVVVVNQAFARRYFAGREAIGQYLEQDNDRGKAEPQIVGEVADTKYYALRQSEEPTVYVPVIREAAYFALRTTQDPASAISAVKQVASELDSNLPIFAIRTQSEAIDQTLLDERLVARLSGLFGLLAIVLASIGLYGLLAYEVARRTRELGIRAALGAQRHDILRLVVGQGFALALAGGATGIAIALALTRYLRSLLFGIEPSDPLTFVSVMLVLFVVAAVACMIPARRATRVDPMIALRYE